MKKKRDSYSYSSFSELYPNEGFYPMLKNVCFSATKQILTSLIFVFRIYPVKGFGFLRSQVMRKFRFKTFLFQFLEFLSSQTRTLLVLIFFSEFLNATQQGYFFSPFRSIAKPHNHPCSLFNFSALPQQPKQTVKILIFFFIFFSNCTL